MTVSILHIAEITLVQIDIHLVIQQNEVQPTVALEMTIRRS